MFELRISLRRLSIRPGHLVGRSSVFLRNLARYGDGIPNSNGYYWDNEEVFRVHSFTFSETANGGVERRRSAPSEGVPLAYLAWLQTIITEATVPVMMLKE